MHIANIQNQERSPKMQLVTLVGIVAQTYKINMFLLINNRLSIDYLSLCETVVKVIH